MIGYWDQDCPVLTSHPNVKATVYVKAKETLISIGNFDDQDQTIRLTIDWKALGLDPAKTMITAPEIKDFQAARTYRINEPILVKSKEGWLLILKGK